jgi:Family of unknown function (DUF5670)
MFVLTLIEFLFMIIWLLGIATSYTLGGFIHVFLAISVLLIISRLICGGPGGGSDDI